MSKRPETGPMKFGEDWCGIFIRGDDAHYFALALRHATANLAGTLAQQLANMASLLERSDQAEDSETQNMKSFDEASDE